MPAHLGVGVTSLYWYFRSKDELMAALTEEAADRLYRMLPDYRGRRWDEHLLRYFRDFRRVFLDNPAMCDLLVLAGAEARPARRRRHEGSSPCSNGKSARLADAGFPVRDAVDAYMTLSVYTRGCVLNERLFRTAEEQAGRGDYLMPQPDMDSGSFPLMAEAAEYWESSFSTQEKFEAGIGFIIDGLRGRLALVAGY